MLKKLRNWFYKDTRVIVRAGPHMEVQHDITLSTVITGNSLDTYTINKQSNPWPVKIGTYSAVSFSNITNPASVVFWLVFNQQMGSVDVAGQIECKTVKPSIYFGCNNPAVLKPYCTIWSADGSIQYQHRLAEGESFTFADHSGHNIHVQRNGDTDYKEFVITIDP
jgi:hypothetical protein